MVILKTDLGLYYSGTAGKSGPGGPQGGVISSVQLTPQELKTGLSLDNTVFPDVTSQEATSGKKQYVCLYLKNNHGTQTASNIKMWQSSITPGRDNIRLGYSGVAANGHDTLLTETNTPVYKVPLSTSESRLDHDKERAGFYVTSESAIIWHKAITVVEIYLKRTGTPTGTLNVRQRNRNSETIRVDFGSKDVTTIDNTTPTLYTFTAAGNTYETPDESIISVEYTAGTETNYISVMRAAGSPVAYMHVVNWDGEQWRSVSDFDLCGNMYTAGTAGDQIAPSVTFENPVSLETAITLPNLTAGSFVPFWAVREVPANCAGQTNNSSELCFRVESPDT